MSEGRDTIRLDKWLWQARFFKTRGRAAEIVAAGKVRVDSIPVSKPSRAVGVGDVLTFPQARRIRVVRIAALGDRRGPAPEAQALYEDLSPPAERPPPPAPERGAARPSGRDRRRIASLKNREPGSGA